MFKRVLLTLVLAMVLLGAGVQLAEGSHQACIEACDDAVVACTNACRYSPNGHACFVTCTDEWRDCLHGC